MKMAAYEFSSLVGKYVKYCSSCDIAFHGAESQDSSEVVFAESFDKNRWSIDGLQNVCKKCFRMNRRSRNGVDQHDEIALFEKQNGKCAICNIDIYMPYRFSADPQGARIDHDHKTGKVRGLLCHPCNIMLGMYETILNQNPKFSPKTIENYIKEGQ